MMNHHGVGPKAQLINSVTYSERKQAADGKGVGSIAVYHLDCS
jgi:hypothetical protein